MLLATCFVFFRNLKNILQELVKSKFNEICGKIMDTNFDMPGWATAFDARTGRQ